MNEQYFKAFQLLIDNFKKPVPFMFNNYKKIIGSWQFLLFSIFTLIFFAFILITGIFYPIVLDKLLLLGFLNYSILCWIGFCFSVFLTLISAIENYYRTDVYKLKIIENYIKNDLSYDSYIYLFRMSQVIDNSCVFNKTRNAFMQLSRYGFIEENEDSPKLRILLACCHLTPIAEKWLTKTKNIDFIKNKIEDEIDEKMLQEINEIIDNDTHNFFKIINYFCDYSFIN